jgi:transcriptional regulator with XRE-family HTH domain
MARGLRKLSDWQIAEILLSRTSDTLTARLYGVSKTAVSNIRNGKSFKDIRPDIERRKPIRQRVKPDPATLEVSCLKCAHWYKGKCTFDFPDPVREGLQVAEECSMYQL